MFNAIRKNRVLVDLSSFGILKNIAVIYVKVLVNVNMIFESLPPKNAGR